VREAVRPIEWKEGRLSLLDQRWLPHEVKHVDCTTSSEVAAAIREMIVRGAPAIGVAAAYGMVLAARLSDGGEGMFAELQRAGDELKASRPTAVNLAWAVDRMLDVAAANRQGTADKLESEAIGIHEADVAANHAIGRHGAALLGQKSTVLTHCNAGALATGGYGTALGVIRAAAESGKSIAVFADETRPWLQGARLTAWELQQEGIDVTLITDNMAGHFFQQKTFDAVVVGADRIAMNGDVANKIGTYTVAVLAAAHGVPFYVAAPMSTLDPRCPNGDAIPIEERSHAEVGMAHGIDEGGELRTVRVAPAGVEARHPAFDVTPSRLVSAIITERGVARAPYEESLHRLLEGSLQAAAKRD
jgi:methylthioribose-1-phosphate isomerase